MGASGAGSGSKVARTEAAMSRSAVNPARSTRRACGGAERGESASCMAAASMTAIRPTSQLR